MKKKMKEINNIIHTDNKIKYNENRLPNLDDTIKDTDQNKEIKDDNINNNINDINQISEKRENNEFNDFEKRVKKQK